MSEFISVIFNLETFIKYWHFYILAAILILILVLELIKGIFKGGFKLIFKGGKTAFKLALKYPITTFILIKAVLILIYLHTKGII